MSEWPPRTNPPTCPRRRSRTGGASWSAPILRERDAHILRKLQGRSATPGRRRPSTAASGRRRASRRTRCAAFPTWRVPGGAEAGAARGPGGIAAVRRLSLRRQRARSRASTAPAAPPAGPPSSASAGTTGSDRQGARAHPVGAWASGPATPVFICRFFSLYMGSWGALARSGAAGRHRLSLRRRRGGPDADGACSGLREIKPTAFYGTPSFALHLAETAREEGVDPRSFGLRDPVLLRRAGRRHPRHRAADRGAFGGTASTWARWPR